MKPSRGCSGITRHACTQLWGTSAPSSLNSSGIEQRKQSQADQAATANTGYGKAGKQSALSNFPTATTTTNYNQYGIRILRPRSLAQGASTLAGVDEMARLPSFTASPTSSTGCEKQNNEHAAGRSSTHIIGARLVSIVWNSSSVRGSSRQSSHFLVLHANTRLGPWACSDYLLMRQSENQRQINKGNRTRVRGQIRKLRAALTGGKTDQLGELLPATISIIDKAVQKGVLHKNAAARHKSRLTRASQAPAK